MEGANMFGEYNTEEIFFSTHPLDSHKLFKNNGIENDVNIKSGLDISNIYGITVYVTSNGFYLMKNVSNINIDDFSTLTYDENGNIINNNIFVYKTDKKVLQLKFSHNEKKLLVLMENNILLMDISETIEPLIVDKYIFAEGNDTFIYAEWSADDRYILMLTKSNKLLCSEIITNNTIILNESCISFSCSSNSDDLTYAYISSEDNENIYFNNFTNSNKLQHKLAELNDSFETNIPIYINNLDANIFCVGLVTNIEEQKILVFCIYHKSTNIEKYKCIYSTIDLGSDCKKYDLFLNGELNEKDLYNSIIFNVCYYKDLNLIIWGTNSHNYQEYLICINEDIKAKLNSQIDISQNNWFMITDKNGNPICSHPDFIIGINFDFTMYQPINFVKPGNDPEDIKVPILVYLSNNYRLYCHYLISNLQLT